MGLRLHSFSINIKNRALSGPEVRPFQGLRQDRTAAHLAGLCGAGGGRPSHAGIRGAVPAAKRKDRACVCRREGKARHALPPIQRLAPGDQLGQA